MTHHDAWLESPYTDAEDGLECDECDKCTDDCAEHEWEDAQDTSADEELAYDSMMESSRDE